MDRPERRLMQTRRLPEQMVRAVLKEWVVRLGRLVSQVGPWNGQYCQVMGRWYGETKDCSVIVSQ